MEIVEDKALLVSAADPSAITTRIKKSADTPHGVLVKWGHTEAEVLAQLGFDPPSPILRDYEWTGRYTPFEHQKTTASFLSLRHRAFCFNEQGTGKTASVIWAADYLMKRKLVSRVLVLCPLSIMKSAWQQDTFKFAMHRSCSVAYGSAKQREKIIRAGADFVVINFDGVATVMDEIMAGGFDLIVVDEASAYKTATTNRWKVLNKIVKATNPRVWMLTGTPAAQSPLDAYGLARMLDTPKCPKYFGPFRDSVMMKVTQFKWAPKPHAIKVVHEILQPAIRFEKKDCLDLPPVTHIEREVELTPQQKKYYNQLKSQMLIEAAGEEVSAVNAATKVNKLLQVSCIARDTPVLTRRGWVCIQNVTSSDEVWDGDNWVSCAGARFMGRKPVVMLDGVRLTEDHRVLTESGWRTAEECLYGHAREGLNRQNVRLPYGYSATRNVQRESEESHVAMSMRLRDRSYTRVAEPKIKASPERSTLWVSKWRTYYRPRNVSYAPVSDMAGHGATLHGRQQQGLSQLWSAGRFSLRQVAAKFLQFLGRYGASLFAGAYPWPGGQQRPVFAGELPVGDREGAGAQYAGEQAYRNSRRDYDDDASIGDIRNSERNFVRAGGTLSVAHGTGADGACGEETYDVINCGPQSRYVVQGATGELMIVHNCGAVYTDEGQVLEFDVSNRLTAVLEVINETSNKVLVFVPFTHTIELLVARLEREGISCDVISGKVPVNRRSDIVTRFQNEAEPKVLVIQPQAASHGLTLTAADTIVWYAPVTSVETYLQANARIDRPGQKNAMTVVHIKGSEVESRLYTMLRNNITNHEKLIDLYRDMLDTV